MLPSLGRPLLTSLPNQQLLRHLHFNLDQFPRRRPSRIVACPKGPLVPSWRLPLPCRLLVSALATRLLRCWWIAERLTILSTRYSLPAARHDERLLRPRCSTHHRRSWSARFSRCCHAYCSRHRYRLRWARIRFLFLSCCRARNRCQPVLCH